MRPLKREDIQYGVPLVTVEMPYPSFVERFGEKHSGHPEDWDAPGPVELWFFELPWGHKVTLEYHLTIEQVNIYLEALEVDAVLGYLDLGCFTHYIHSETIRLLRERHPLFSEGISPTNLYRQDDNGNVVLMQTYESRRVAEYFRSLYERRGHKQLYWIDDAAIGRPSA